MNPATHPVVTRQRWLAEREALLSQEKELTQLRDRIAAQRQALPWVRVEQDYLFDTTEGPRRLSQLFEGRHQLLVQHFMLGPGWEAGCPSCSFMADHMGGMQLHLAARDVTVMAVSRAPLAEIERFRQRMGWRFRWVSAHGNRFNQDYAVSFSPEQVASKSVVYNYGHTEFGGEEAPGISLFYRGDAGEVFHTYSTYGRGVEAMMGTYNLLDLAPLGRNERDVPYKMEWVRHHDRYEAPQPAPRAAACAHCEA